MIDAIDALSVLQFVLLTLAAFATLVQLGLIAAVALRGGAATLFYGYAAVALWIAFFVVTR